MQVVSASFTFEVQDVLQVLDLLLQLLHERVVSGAHLVRADFRHDLLGAVCELESRNRFFGVVDQRTGRSD